LVVGAVRWARDRDGIRGLLDDWGLGGDHTGNGHDSSVPQQIRPLNRASEGRVSLLDKLLPEQRKQVRRTGKAAWSPPMLATLTHEHFSSRDWIYERKLDGERFIAVRRGRAAEIYSRNHLRIAGAYPEVREALAGQDARDFTVDGEVVAFEGSRTSFSRLQRRMQTRDPDQARRSGVAVYYYVFDVLHVDGYDVTGLPLRWRKRLLRQVLLYGNPLRFTTHRNTEGERFLEEACRRAWEGLIAKRADSTYVHTRSTDWLKFKCVNSQEFVIGGYTEPSGSRQELGALLIGYYEDRQLRYAGKVGTGFDDRMLRDLGQRLRRLERRDSPFADEVPGRTIHWVKPELVGEVGFTEWTTDGRLRHPRFLGLRRDKRARDVARERPS
jgi:bifunctional non-homologous end joining protein LigD